MMGVDECAPTVIPAQAGIQAAAVRGSESVWVPAFAGMTEE
jgi:hypothetical protein